MNEASALTELPISPEISHSRVGITISQHITFFESTSPLEIEGTDAFSQLCREFKEVGADKQRVDWRWDNVEPDQGNADYSYLARSRKLSEIASREGIGTTIVLTHTPKWALELVKKDHSAFIGAYEDYVDNVFSALAPGDKPPVIPANIQIFNELNSPLYTPDELLPLIPDCVRVLKAKSLHYFHKEIPLIATLNVTEIPLKSLPKILHRPKEFIAEHQPLLGQFDEIALDYYPGIWHLPAKTITTYLTNLPYFIKAFSNRNSRENFNKLTPPLFAFRTIFGNMDLLEQTLQQLRPLAREGKIITIGEIGVPTLIPFERSAIKEEHGKMQALGVLIMFSRLRRLIHDYDIKNVGLYCLTNKPEPEGPFELGWIRNDGTKKYMMDMDKGTLKKLITLLRRPYDPIKKN